MNFIEKVKKYIDDNHLINKKDRIVLGLSGGVDSVGLFLFFLSIKNEYNLEIIPVHINHNLRKEAFSEEKFVIDLCKKYNEKCIVFSEDIKRISKEKKEGIEECGRNIRRERFLEVLRLYSANCIALAHHKNDQCETVLFRMSRGTSVFGLSGIKPKNKEYIRPFLNVKKEEIITFVEHMGEKYCIDKSNRENIYKRNYIRNIIIDGLERNINDKTVDHISKLCRDVLEYESIIKKRIDIIYKDLVEIKNNKVIIKYDISLLDGEIKGVIKRALEELNLSLKNIGRNNIEKLVELYKKNNNRQINLPYNLIGEMEYGFLYIYNKDYKSNRNYKKTVEFSILKDNTNDTYEEIESNDIVDNSIRYSKKNNKVIIDNDYILVKEISIEEYKNNSLNIKGNKKTKVLDYDIINKDFSIRNKKEGDYIYLDNNNKKKLSRLFIDKKIPKEVRDNILLLEVDGEIILVEDYYQNKKSYIKDNTKNVLLIEFKGGNYE